MVFANKYAELFLNEFPKFKTSLSFKNTIDLYSVDNEPISINTIFSGLTDYLCDKVVGKNEYITKEETEIFECVEKALEKFKDFPSGSDENEFYNAACVSFLENLLNYASAQRLKYSRFIPLLGGYSRKFCKAWDEFTGVRSPGLWTDAEWCEIEQRRNDDIP